MSSTTSAVFIVLSKRERGLILASLRRAAKPAHCRPNRFVVRKARSHRQIRTTKRFFSKTLEEPLTWANSTVIRDDAVEAVRRMKADSSGVLSTIGSLSLVRSLLGAGLVDRFRVVVFPVITGATGRERIYDGYPDVALDMIASRTFDGRIQMLEYRPRVLDRPGVNAG